MTPIVPTRVGLLGWPVGHSRSPAMHNAAFRHLGLDWEYLLLPVRPPDLLDAVRGLRALRFAGVNVTVPHKQAVLEGLDEIAPEASAIGAVNTIVIRHGLLTGYNTDAPGFIAALQEAGVVPRERRVLLLGAGGASRAVLYALLDSGARVTIANRTEEAAQALAAEFGDLFGAEVEALALHEHKRLQELVEQADLLVNATSVGMRPHTQDSPLPPSIVLRPALTVYDLVYNPRRTCLLDAAVSAGARAVDGLGMLVHQGAVAFELWTGKEAPVEVMRAAAEGQ